MLKIENIRLTQAVFTHSCPFEGGGFRVASRKAYHRKPTQEFEKSDAII
jgi:hypothetical protein